MRINSPQQSHASRSNGAQSRGPISSEGKNKVRLNAFKEGLFSTRVVIESAGECVQEFQEMKCAIWQELRPAGALEELLAADFLEDWWRRRRVRGAEWEELKDRLEVLDKRDYLRRIDQVESLKVQFRLLCVRTMDGASDLIFELESVRAKLASSSFGVNFLLRTLESLEEDVRRKGWLSAESEVILKACGGFQNEIVSEFIKINRIETPRPSEMTALERLSHKAGECKKGESEVKRSGKTHKKAFNHKQILEEMAAELKGEDALLQKILHSCLSEKPLDIKKLLRMLQVDEVSQDERSREFTSRCISEPNGSGKGILLVFLQSLKADLQARQKYILDIERSVRHRRSAMAICSARADRFARAETTYERRMYRALAALSQLRSKRLEIKSLPTLS